MMMPGDIDLSAPADVCTVCKGQGCDSCSFVGSHDGYQRTHNLQVELARGDTGEGRAFEALARAGELAASAGVPLISDACQMVIDLLGLEDPAPSHWAQNRMRAGDLR